MGKSFGGFAAVRDVSFGVPKGVCFGLLGPNGAGKTTTISMIAGTLDADAGEISLDGQAVGRHNLEPKKRVGYVPQELALYEDLSATDNLKFFGMLYQLSGTTLKRRIEAALEISGLEDRRKGPVREFSGGMKRRLNIAAALLHEPDFLILDEPTVGVDPQSRNLIFRVLESLRAEGKTVLYTTHYMEEVERLCQRAAIMDGGRIVAEGDLSDLYALTPKKTAVRVEMANRPDGQTSLGLEFNDLSRELPPALAALVAAGGDIVDVRTERPTLEEVFLHLTGHRLRD